MLVIDEDGPRGCIVVTSAGVLTRKDLDLLDQWVAGAVSAGRKPNMLICADGFPTWTDLATLTRHVRFIRRRHHAIGRIAIVSDARGMALAPRLGRWLVSADVRQFSTDRLDEAQQWLGAGTTATRLDGMPVGVVGLSLRGPLDAELVSRLLAPALADRPCGLLLQIERGFQPEDVAPGTLGTAAAGLTGVAILAEGKGFRRAVALLRPFMPMPVSTFGLSEREAALAWLADAASSQMDQKR